jgi:hypothetical protein
MKDKAKFEWKRLASKSQGGLNDNGNPYGASPFISNHFKGDEATRDYGEETAEQKKARMKFMKKHFGNTEVAPQTDEAEASRILHSHFANVPETKPRSAPVVEQKRQWKIEDLLEDTRNWYEDLSKKEQTLFDFALNNPDAKLAKAIEVLKAKDYTGIAPGTVSPVFKEIKQNAKEAIEEAIKAEDFERRSKPIRALLKKKIQSDKKIRSAQRQLRDLKQMKMRRGAGLPRVAHSASVKGGMTHTYSTPKAWIDSLPIERKRTMAPPSVVQRALADVKKLESIPYKKMSKEEASKMFWGENPMDVQSVLIDLPVIEIPHLRVRDVRNHTIFQTIPSMKKQGFVFRDKGCILTHKGEIITIYITGADDRAVREGAKHLDELVKQMKEYYPRKADTFYTGFKLTKDKDEQQKASTDRKKNPPKAKYYGWNALDGMIRYFTAKQHGNVYAYHPRKPQATFDNDFLYNLIYSYNSIYALEKRYAPAVAEYRLQKAKKADKAQAIPGDPMTALPATSLGASEDFASALHDDSGIRGITETILWNKLTGKNKSYFVNDQAKMAFDLSKDNAIVLIPPKISHGTANTGKHGGAGFVIITKANQVWETPDNIAYQRAWEKYTHSPQAKEDFHKAKGSLKTPVNEIVEATRV